MWDISSNCKRLHTCVYIREKRRNTQRFIDIIFSLSSFYLCIYFFSRVYFAYLRSDSCVSRKKSMSSSIYRQINIYVARSLFAKRKIIIILVEEGEQRKSKKMLLPSLPKPRLYIRLLSSLCRRRAAFFINFFFLFVACIVFDFERSRQN